MLADETLRLMEERAVKALQEGTYYDVGTPERKALNTEAKDLLDRCIEAHRQELDYWDKEQRRNLEKERNEETAAIEREKMDVNWKRFLLEGAKIVVPAVVSLFGYAAYDTYQRRVMEYEKDGSIKSTAGRQLGLPRILK